MRKSSRALSVKTIVVTSLLTLFSCSIPFFGKGRTAPATGEISEKMATLSGVLEFKEGCGPGYYKVVLKGLFEGAGVQVETQSDSLGKFSISAPPGKYLAQVVRDQCGAKVSVDLQSNTDHMFSFVVQESRAVEKVSEQDGKFPSRLPASVLIMPETSN